MKTTSKQNLNDFNQLRYGYPDENGHYGVFGGTFVAETLIQPLTDLKNTYYSLKNDPDFLGELYSEFENYVGRPTPLYFAKRLTDKLNGANIFLKREDLCHTGAHKINNTIGQAILAKKMGKTRIIAETGAGQHGVASATVAARLGMQCVVYMGEQDIYRQSQNVYRMKLLGAEVVPVTSGSRTLKDALNEALRDWVTNVDNTFYIIGTVAGPSPYPELVRDFQAIIGREVITQMQDLDKKVDALVACVGGGSNAIGLFYPFINSDSKMYGIEAAGNGLETGKHSAPLNKGKIGVLHGNRTYLLEDENGQIIETHSISAGLDYPGVGPEHALLKDLGLVEYESATDKEAIDAFHEMSKVEGIIPALETSHAIAYTMKLAKKMKKNQNIVINLSGRGDKDLNTVAKLEGIKI